MTSDIGGVQVERCEWKGYVDMCETVKEKTYSTPCRGLKIICQLLCTSL